MRLWRLSSARRARDFDGGYGLANNGRWNSKGRPLTYCSTVPSLAVLEKRVHVTDPGLLPPQALVEYDVPDDIPTRTISIGGPPNDWTMREIHTQRLGDEWLDQVTEALLIVPSVNRNVLINHRHADVARISIAAVTSFTLDPRLFHP
jgi:RES domain-containing protein